MHTPVAPRRKKYSAMHNHPPTPESTERCEREALYLAQIFGPALLTSHGLKSLHFTETRGRLFHLLCCAAQGMPDGIPPLERIKQLMEDTADSGIPPEEIPLMLAEISTGIGSDTHAEWYAREIIGAWHARETLRLAIAMNTAAENGDMEKVDSLRRKLNTLRQTVAAQTAIPLIEVFTPSQCKAYVPPAGHILVGDNHISRGALTVIAGPPGCGKSRALHSVALAGAHGTGEWMGLKIHRSFRTLIIQCENGRVRLRDEFAEFDAPGMDESIRISAPPDCGLAFEDPAFQDALRLLYAEFPADLVAIDPWSQVAKDDKGKDYRAALISIRECFPGGDSAPALAIIAHTRKPREDERSNGRALLNVIAGSFILGAAARSAFVLQHASNDTEDDRVVWTCCKNNNGLEGPRSAWHRRNGLFVPCEDFDWQEFDGGEKKGRGKVTAADIAEVFADGKPLTKAEAAVRLMELTGVSRPTAYRALQPGKFPGLVEFNGLLRLSQSQTPLGE
jgi:energy-coupling factor transporter ATP-binding protein EcfA2